MNEFSLYNLPYLRYKEYTGIDVYIEYTSKKHPEQNYKGKVIFKSNNLECCVLISRNHQLFTFHFHECKNGVAEMVTEDEVLKIFKIHNKTRPELHIDFRDLGNKIESPPLD